MTLLAIIGFAHAEEAKAAQVEEMKEAEEAEEAEEVQPELAEELTFFDFLGAMVEEEDGWLDPLQLHEQDELLEADEDTETGKISLEEQAE